MITRLQKLYGVWVSNFNLHEFTLTFSIWKHLSSLDFCDRLNWVEKIRPHFTSFWRKQSGGYWVVIFSGILRSSWLIRMDKQLIATTRQLPLSQSRFLLTLFSFCSAQFLNLPQKDNNVLIEVRTNHFCEHISLNYAHLVVLF